MTDNIKTLDDWNKAFAEDFDETQDAPRGFGFDAQKFYRLRIKSAQVEQSPSGYVNLHCETQVLDADDKERGAHRLRLTLPKQAKDMDFASDPDKVRKMTYRRRDDIKKVLECVYPDQYSAMENSKEVNAAVMATCDGLHTAIGDVMDDFSGAEVLFSQAPNKNKPEYPYDNIHGAVEPKGKTLWEG